MSLEKLEQWREVAQEASVENDPVKLIELTRKLSDLLDPERKKEAGAEKLDGVA